MHVLEHEFASEAALRYFRAGVSFKVSRVILKCTARYDDDDDDDDSGVLHDFGSLWERPVVTAQRHEKITVRWRK